MKVMALKLPGFKITVLSKSRKIQKLGHGVHKQRLWHLLCEKNLDNTKFNKLTSTRKFQFIKL